MNTALDPGKTFEKRAARAETLAAAAPAVEEPLLFAAKLFRLQGRLAAALAARHADAPFSGRADDLPRIVDLLSPLLSFAATDAPSELAEAAEARAKDDAATAATRLRVYWEGGRDATEDYLSRAFLRSFAETLAARGVPLERPRHEGHCPACGSAPVVSYRKELPESNGGARFLVCALCGTDWPFNRIRCPSCHEEDPARLPGFQSDVHKNVRIEACETCRRYVKSIDLTLDARPLPEVDDLVSLAMDLWAIEEGWTRLEPGWAGIWKVPALFALVFVGGGIGSVCRYAMASALQRTFPGPFPAGTFWVNLAGCFAIGLVGTLGLERAALSPEARTFLMVGILGGFTTFSAFAWETLGLLSVRDVLRASLYVGGSVFCGLLGAFLGRVLGRIGT